MPENDREARLRRRALLKAHHPDIGGDPAQFLRLMAALEAGGGRSTPSPTRTGEDVRFVRRPKGLRRLAAWYQRRRRPPRVL